MHDNVISVREISERQNREWDGFIDSETLGTRYHKSSWLTMYEDDFGLQVFRLAALDDHNVIHGVLPLVRLNSCLFGDFLISLPYVNYGGVVTSSPSTARCLIEASVVAAEGAGVQHVEYRHRIRHDLVERTDKVCMMLDLPLSIKELGVSIGAKRRSQVRRPLKEGATVDIGGSELLYDFYDVFATNMRDLGTPVYGKSFFSSVMKVLGEDGRIVIVRIKKKPIAAALLLRYQGTMEVPWASSLARFNRIGANMLLYWSALECAINIGCDKFDFGRSSIGSGTYRFKKQWGAIPVQQYWHYWLSPNTEIPHLNPQNPKYELAIRVWRKLPVTLTKWIGPRIVMNLP